MSGPFDLSGRVALVTGGSGRLGAPMAHALAAAGARVLLTGRTASSLEAVAAELGDACGGTWAVDLTEDGGVDSLFDSIEAGGEEIDVLVNNAGIASTARLGSVRAEDFDAVHLPGGTVNADRLRTNPDVHRFLRAMDAQGKTIAAICHAPWILISAGLVPGHTLTSYPTLADDVRNAGGEWVDQAVVEDRNWITSRSPKDLAAFNEHLLIHLSSRQYRHTA